MKSVSVIIPLYNERETLRELYARLCAELKKTGMAAEIIFVDDGSRDGSDEILGEIRKQDSSVRISNTWGAARHKEITLLSTPAPVSTIKKS